MPARQRSTRAPGHVLAAATILFGLAGMGSVARAQQMPAPQMSAPQTAAPQPSGQPPSGQPPSPSGQPPSGQPPSRQQSPTPDNAAGTPDAEGFWDRGNLTGDWYGLRTKWQDAGLTLGLQEQSEVWGNLVGGLKQGVVYDGLTTASLGLDLDKLVGWTGASFFVDAYQIHGRGPSGNLIGNQQLVSNIEATRDTKLYQLYLEQKLWDGRLTVRIGQEGANDQMMVTQYGALFLNGSFGFPGLAAADLPSGGPNYPMATPFVRAQFQATDQLTLVGALFNGDPAPPGTGDPQLRDAGGTAFRLDGHVLAFSELWYSINQGDSATGLPGTYKLGAWYSSSHYQDQFYDTSGQSLASPTSTGIPRGHSTGYAIYGIVDQMVWQKPDAKGKGIGVFMQAMGAPAGYNLSNLFVEGGLNWIGPFEGRDNDTFGLGVSYLGISPAARRYGDGLIYYNGFGTPYASNETVVELTYVYQVTPWWMMQPDLQVVVNPGANIPSSASSKPLKNDVIVGVRLTVTF